MASFNQDIKEEVAKMKDELDGIKNQSFAFEILRDYKRQNKRFFILNIMLCLMLTGLGVYTIWLLNDIGYEEVTETTTTEYTQDIDDTGNINNSNIVNGGDVNGKN